MKKTAIGFFLIMPILTAVSCTFDYGETEASDSKLPNLIMENVEYVRMRSADPIAKFTAERAERYEKQGIMKLQNFSFEQYGERGEEVNTTGRVENAEINIDSGDIFMEGVKIEVESEDIILETSQLEWLDEPRLLSAGEENEVTIYQSNGTGFSGIGFHADARKRTWEFTGNVSGTFVFDDDEEDEDDEYYYEYEDYEWYERGRE